VFEAIITTLNFFTCWAQYLNVRVLYRLRSPMW